MRISSRIDVSNKSRSGGRLSQKRSRSESAKVFDFCLQFSSAGFTSLCLPQFSNMLILWESILVGPRHLGASVDDSHVSFYATEVPPGLLMRSIRSAFGRVSRRVGRLVFFFLC